MLDYSAHLDWIDTLQEQMCHQVIDWCNINSGTENRAGIAAMASVLRKEFGVLGGTFEEVPVPPVEAIDSRGRPTQLPLGPALRFTKRHPAGAESTRPGDRPLRVLLNIHRDTVYGIDHPFQTCTRLDGNTLGAPV